MCFSLQINKFLPYFFFIFFFLIENNNHTHTNTHIQDPMNIKKLIKKFIENIFVTFFSVENLSFVAADFILFIQPRWDVERDKKTVLEIN